MRKGTTESEKSSTVRRAGPTCDMVGDNDGMGIAVCGGTAWRQRVSRPALWRAVPPGQRPGSAFGGGNGARARTYSCRLRWSRTSAALRRRKARDTARGRRRTGGSRKQACSCRVPNAPVSACVAHSGAASQSRTWPANARVRHPTRAACVQPTHCFAAWRPPAREAADAAPCGT